MSLIHENFALRTVGSREVKTNENHLANWLTYSPIAQSSDLPEADQSGRGILIQEEFLAQPLEQASAVADNHLQ